MKHAYACTAVLSVLALAILSATALAVPAPSWDWAAMESSAVLDDPAQTLGALTAKFTTKAAPGTPEQIRPAKSTATYLSPQLVRASVLAEGHLRHLGAEQVAADWAVWKEDLSRYLPFRIALLGETPSYGGIANPRSAVDKVVLVNDKGYEVTPAWQVSSTPVMWYGEGFMVFNQLWFPLTTDAGKPMIGPTTRYLEIQIEYVEGTALFRFTFDDPPGEAPTGIPAKSQVQLSQEKALISSNPRVRLEFFKKATKQKSKDPAVWYEWGRIQMDLMRYDEAASALERATKLDSSPDPIHLILLGSVYDALGRRQDSLNALLKATKIAPDSYQAHSGLGRAYATLGYREASAAEYEKAAALAPGEARSHFDLGNAYARLKRYDDAVKEFERAIELAPNDANLRLGYASTLFYFMRRGEDAARELKEVIRLDPNLAEAHLLLGEYYAGINRRDLALAEYEILKGIDPRLAQLLFSRIPVNQTGSTSTGYAEGETKEFTGEGFSIRYPASLDVRRETPIDFDILTFTKQGQTLLKAYVGNFPSKKEAGVTARLGSINGNPYEEQSKVDHAGLRSRDVIIRIATEGFPCFIHFWYRDIDPELAAIADDIIGSTRSTAGR